VKQLLLLGIPLLSVWGCTPPPAPPQTTSFAFDGSYSNPVVNSRTATCPPNLPALPPLTVANGQAVWKGPNFAFQGSVTPEGVLAMNSSTGQTFQGQFDQMHVLRAHVVGPNCTYDLTLTPTT
jgi:hypothetical protein